MSVAAVALLVTLGLAGTAQAAPNSCNDGGHGHGHVLAVAGPDEGCPGMH